MTQMRTWNNDISKTIHFKGNLMNKLLIVIIPALFIYGCASPDGQPYTITSDVGYKDNAVYTPPSNLSEQSDSDTYSNVRLSESHTTLLSIFFDKNKSILKPNSNGTLQLVNSFLQDNPTATLEIQGNASDVGTAKYNYNLGLKRANAVKQKLISLGANPDNITVVSYGFDRPAFKTDAENRRADITFTSSVTPSGYQLIKNKIPAIITSTDNLKIQETQKDIND